MQRVNRGLVVALGSVFVASSGGLNPDVATADEPAHGELLHAVSHTVFSDRPFHGAEIYFRERDPSRFSDYSHDPYSLSPNVEADLGPSTPWTMDAMLADPDLWAMVAVSSLDAADPPKFHCLLTVDGQVVAAKQGFKGTLCSMRR